MAATSSMSFQVLKITPTSSMSLQTLTPIKLFKTSKKKNFKIQMGNTFHKILVRLFEI